MMAAFIAILVLVVIFGLIALSIIWTTFGYAVNDFVETAVGYGRRARFQKRMRLTIWLAQTFTNFRIVKQGPGSNKVPYCVQWKTFMTSWKTEHRVATEEEAKEVYEKMVIKFVENIDDHNTYRSEVIMQARGGK